jgi:hypothetical protein
MEGVTSKTSVPHLTLWGVVREATKNSTRLYFLPVIFVFRIINQIYQKILNKAQQPISRIALVQEQMITLEQALMHAQQLMQHAQIKLTIWEEWMQEYTRVSL